MEVCFCRHCRVFEVIPWLLIETAKDAADCRALNRNYIVATNRKVKPIEIKIWGMSSKEKGDWK